MDDYRSEITACCKQLRLSANLVENAMRQEGETHQEYENIEEGFGEDDD